MPDIRAGTLADVAWTRRPAGNHPQVCCDTYRFLTYGGLLDGDRWRVPALFLGYGSAEVQGRFGLLVGSFGAFAIALRTLRV